MKNSLISLAFISVMFSSNAMSQAKLDPLAVRQSSLIDQIKELKAADPKMPVSELVLAANPLLDKNGVGFQLSLDAVTCGKIWQLKQKDPTKPLPLGASLLSVDADRVSVSL